MKWFCASGKAGGGIGPERKPLRRNEAALMTKAGLGGAEPRLDRGCPRNLDGHGTRQHTSASAPDALQVRVVVSFEMLLARPMLRSGEKYTIRLDSKKA